MPVLEPSIALTTCETALRELMSYSYAATYGDGWLMRIAKEETIELWTSRADDEVAARGSKGVVAVPNVGLSYTNFYDLVRIADKHWEPLAAALGKKADALPLLRRFDSLRNTIGHSRPLVAFEQDLLSGIAGQIRNQVTIFMSEHDEVGDIYPRIESIGDGFGRRIESSVAAGEIAGAITEYDIVVRPGDHVVFTCIGLDPQGRNLEWTLVRWGKTRANVVGPSGEPTDLEWVVDDAEVTETYGAEIYLATHGAKYHRFGTWDHRSYFNYRVRPPA